MSRKTSEGPLPDREMDTKPGHAVGYGRPPVETRFKAGQSGNPKGRPKGAKNKPHPVGSEPLKEILLQEAYRTVTVRDGDRNLTVPMAQAVVRSIAVNAAKGHNRAQRLFTELVRDVEQENRRVHDEYLEMWLKYKFKWMDEFERCKALNIEPPNPLPHPDHVIIDLRENTVRIIGPVIEEEKAKYDLWIERKGIIERACEDLREAVARARKPELKAKYREELAGFEKALELLNCVFQHGGWWKLPKD